MSNKAVEKGRIQRRLVGYHGAQPVPKVEFNPRCSEVSDHCYQVCTDALPHTASLAWEA